MADPIITVCEVFFNKTDFCVAENLYLCKFNQRETV